MACEHKEKFDNGMSFLLDERLGKYSKEKFGENFAQFEGKPKDAINHLLEVKTGQVVGAMNKKEVGDIDFIYGEIVDPKKHTGLGLAHIVDKHGEDVARLIPQIIEESELVLKNKRRAILETKDHRVIIGLVYDDIDKIWLLSGFERTDVDNNAKGSPSSQTPDLGSSGSGGTRLTTSLTKIIADGKKKIKKLKKSPNKVDEIVDAVWDGVMKGFDIAATPVKYGLGAMNKNIDPSRDWFGVTTLQKDVSEIVNSYRNVKANIYESAGDIKEYLGTLSKEDSQSLVRALNGDIEATELKGNLVDLYGRFREVIDTKADELVKLGVLDEKNKIEHYLKRYYTQYVEEGHSGSSIAYSKLKKRKDLSLEERIALGMLEDADFVIPQTIAEQNVLIEKAKTLKTLADKFGLDEEKEGYVKISDESVGGGVKKWGALAGKYVPLEVKKELDHARFVADQNNILETGLYPIIDHLKVNLTVKNPVTHVYNIASNVLLAGLNGDLMAVGKVLHMRAKAPNEFKKLLKQANKHGLNSYLDDFETAHIALEADGKVNPVASIWKNLYMTQDSKLGKNVRKLYDWEDKLFKLSAFKKYLDEGVPEKDAFKQATDVYVDYSTPLPAAVRVLDKSGLMPFLHYQYKSTPAVAKVMAKNPLRTALMATGAATLGITSFQNDEEELLTPDWADDKFNLFGVAEWVRLGNGYYLNAGRMIPATKFEFELGGIVKGAMDIINGKTPLGYNIGSKYDTELEKYGKRALVMAENYLPSLTLGRYMQRGVHIGLADAGIVEGKKNYYGEDMTFTELGSRAMGVRKFNEAKEAQSKLKAAKNKKKHQTKKGTDKKKTEEEYNKTAQRVNKAATKAGVVLPKGKDDFSFNVGFELKDGKFTF